MTTTKTKTNKEMIKTVCDKFPIEKIHGFDSNQIKALLFILSKRDVMMLEELTKLKDQQFQQMIDNFNFSIVILDVCKRVGKKYITFTEVGEEIRLLLKNKIKGGMTLENEM